LPTKTALPTTTIIDLHQDMLAGVSRRAGGFSDYGSRFLAGPARTAALLSSMYPHDEDASLLGQLAAHEELLATHSAVLRLVTTVDDLDADDPRTGVLPHSEGLTLPDVEPETVESLWAEHSLRSLALTWNHETDYGYSCYEHEKAPLKPAGRQLLGALEKSPILLDLAHLNEGGFYDALDSYAPPDEQLRALGEHGGLVGLAFDPDFLGQGSVDDALRHIDRIATLAGEDAVSIGSDWGVAEMGELGDPESLVELVVAVGRGYGQSLADRFAFANAYDFLRSQLPLSA
jgi:microsomal dipeptidase-like Zn-dependent dipeptidase